MTKIERGQVAQLLAEKAEMRVVRFKIQIAGPTSTGLHFDFKIEDFLVIDNSEEGDITAVLGMALYSELRRICKHQHGGKTVAKFELVDIPDLDQK